MSIHKLQMSVENTDNRSGKYLHDHKRSSLTINATLAYRLQSTTSGDSHFFERWSIKTTMYILFVVYIALNVKEAPCLI